MKHPVLRHIQNGVIVGRFAPLMKNPDYEKVFKCAETGEITLDPEFQEAVEVAIPVEIDIPEKKAPNKKAVPAKARTKARKPKATTAPVDPLDDIGELLDDLGNYENGE